MGKFDEKDWLRLLSNVLGVSTQMRNIRTRTDLNRQRNQRESERHAAYMNRMRQLNRPKREDPWSKIGASDATKLEVLGRVQRHGGDENAAIEEIQRKLQEMSDPTYEPGMGSTDDPEKLQRTLYALQLMRGKMGEYFDGVQERMGGGAGGMAMGSLPPQGAPSRASILSEQGGAGGMAMAPLPPQGAPSRASILSEQGRAVQRLGMTTQQAFAAQMRPTPQQPGASSVDSRTRAMVEQAHAVITDPNSDDRDRAIAWQAVKDLIPVGQSVYFDQLLQQPEHYDPNFDNQALQQWFGAPGPDPAQARDDWERADMVRRRR